MHTQALPKSVLYIELGPQRPMAHYELAYLIKIFFLNSCGAGTQKKFGTTLGWRGWASSLVCCIGAVSLPSMLCLLMRGLLATVS